MKKSEEHVANIFEKKLEFQLKPCEKDPPDFIVIESGKEIAGLEVTALKLEDYDYWFKCKKYMEKVSSDLIPSNFSLFIVFKGQICNKQLKNLKEEINVILNELKNKNDITNYSKDANNYFKNLQRKYNIECKFVERTNTKKIVVGNLAYNLNNSNNNLNLYFLKSIYEAIERKSKKLYSTNLPLWLLLDAGDFPIKVYDVIDTEYLFKINLTNFPKFERIYIHQYDEIYRVY